MLRKCRLICFLRLDQTLGQTRSLPHASNSVLPGCRIFQRQVWRHGAVRYPIFSEHARHATICVPTGYYPVSFLVAQWPPRPDLARHYFDWLRRNRLAEDSQGVGCEITRAATLLLAELSRLVGRWRTLPAAEDERSYQDIFRCFADAIATCQCLMTAGPLLRKLHSPAAPALRAFRSQELALISSRHRQASRMCSLRDLGLFPRRCRCLREGLTANEGSAIRRWPQTRTKDLHYRPHMSQLHQAHARPF